MKLKKPLLAATLSVCLSTAALAGIPDKEGASPLGPLGMIQTANAAEDALSSAELLGRLNELHEALLAGDPADVQDVRNLRTELLSLDPVENAQLLAPIWNKISAKLPEDIDQSALRASLFRLIQEAKAIQYDPKVTDLEAIRTNPEYRATLKTIAAAGGYTDVTMDDFLVFLFGDGNKLDGIEGTVTELLSKMNTIQLIGLLGNKDGMTSVMLKAADKLLADKKGYPISAMLKEFGINSKDIGLTVEAVQNKLQMEGPAFRALTVAYMRTATEAEIEESKDGREKEFKLHIYNVDVPSFILTWSKVSGSEDVQISPDGKATLAEDAAEGTAIIQAALLNPYGGPSKVIYQSEVTLTAKTSDSEDEQKIAVIMQNLDDDLADVMKKLEKAKNAPQKINLMMKAVKAGLDADKKLYKLDVSKEAQADAFMEINTKVNTVLTAIIRDLLQS
ncbi:hypothetical protein [Paenibacillus sp. HB172176]|uniref:hypothetical protein n=1 Tax=Paenibacillus sp. HB172176 TaxID=2493690 RepID=UPI001438CAC5|nr:hypothetical protein [Paenibacillus sp. HB172176]